MWVSKVESERECERRNCSCAVRVSASMRSGGDRRRAAPTFYPCLCPTPIPHRPPCVRRLYIRAANDPARRSCQTVLYALLRGMLGALAPITPHMAEDAWQNMGPVSWSLGRVG